MSIIKNYLNKISLSKPITYENMSVIPIKVNDEYNLDFYTLKEAEEKDLILISEVSEDGSVDNLRIINKGDKPILILDGEELIGAKQNRSINISVLIAEKTKVIVPVSCVEAGRWEYESTDFKSGDNFISSKIRKNRDVKVRESIQMFETFTSDQNEVWEDVNELLVDLEVKSDTDAFHDSVEEKSELIKKYTDKFTLFKGQSGLLIWINGELQGFESIYNQETYKKFHKKIIQSYVLDAIAKNTSNNSLFEEIDYKKEAIKFLKSASNCDETWNKSVSYGKEYSFTNSNIIGSSLEYKGALLHTKLYPIENKIHINEETEWEELIIE